MTNREEYDLKRKITIRLLQNLHAFNKLDSKMIAIINDSFNPENENKNDELYVGAFQICKDKGIIYNV